MQVRIVENITKEYPDMIKVTLFKQPKYYVYEEKTKRNKEQVDDEYYSPKITSLSRTKGLIKDIVLCNDFDYFVTFTFNPKKVDSMNFNRALSTMRIWLHRQHDKDRNFAYLIIPEQHKSGAWHFHGLISHYNGALRDSKCRSGSGRPVYNVTGFRSGFTTAVAIDSKEAVANYVTKYITKDFIKKFNQRRFFCSRNLRRPVRSVNSPVFANTPPLFRRKVMETYDSESYELFLP